MFNFRPKKKDTSAKHGDSNNNNQQDIHNRQSNMGGNIRQTDNIRQNNPNPNNPSNPNRMQNTSPPNKNRIVNKNSSSYEEEEKKGVNKALIGVCVTIVLMCLIVIIIFWQKSSNEKLRADQAVKSIKDIQEQLKKDKETGNNEVGTKAGAPNLYWDTITQNDATIEDFSSVLRSLKGVQLDPNYKIKKIDQKIDFVNYTKHRSKTGDGLEFYWLDAMYRDRPYLVQVPLEIFKELPKQGITVVNLEVTTLDNNEEVVTYMRVRQDYKSLLEKNEK